MSLKVAFFEPEPRGHHLALYARNIFREGLRRGWQIRLITGKQAVEHPAYKMLAAEYGDQISVTLIDDVIGVEKSSGLTKMKQQFERWKTYRTGYREVLRDFQPDVCYVNSLEKIDVPMGFWGSPFGRTPFSGLMILRHFHCKHMGIKTEPMGRADQILEWAFRRTLRIPLLRRLLVIDPLLAQYCRDFGLAKAEKVHFVPDLSSIAGRVDIVDPRAELGIPKDLFVILNYGALSPRKGVEESLAALAHPDCPSHVGLLLAGKQDADIEATLNSDIARRLIEQKRLFAVNRYLDDREESLCFQAADAVWVGYKRFYGMSGVLVQSASSGLPVISSDEGLIAHLVEKEGLGVTTPIHEPEVVAQAIAKLVTMDRAAIAERSRTMAANHTPELFAQRVCDHIEATASGK